LRRRKRIDWDEELKQTERIRWKGVRLSIASFCLAAFWIFGVGRMGRKDISTGQLVLVLLFLGAAMLLFIFIMRRRQR